VRTKMTESKVVFDDGVGPGTLQSMTMRTVPRDPPRTAPAGFTRSLITEDIPGAQTRLMYDPSKPPVDVSKISDIPGARPKGHTEFARSHRHSNPVDPVYQLPSSPPVEPIVPRFIRDTMDNDVPGAHPHVRVWDKPARDIMSVSDIDGARAPPPPKRQSTFDVSDINGPHRFRSKRHLNPLTPEYDYPGYEPDDFGHRVEPRLWVHPQEEVDGARADTVTARYRAFRAPPPAVPERKVDGGMLMLPSMVKQGEEVVAQRRAADARRARLAAFQNRQLGAHVGAGDPVQAVLRRQRQDTFG